MVLVVENHSENTVNSFLEDSLGYLAGSLLIVQDEKHQLQRDFDNEVERL